MDWKPYWNLGGFDDEFDECLLSTQDGRCAEILSRYKTLEGRNWAVFSVHLPRIGEISQVGHGHYLIKDKSKDRWQHGITLEGFKNKNFDVVICSAPANQITFTGLVNTHAPQAKLIYYHSGINQNIFPSIKNVISNSPIQVPDDTNYVQIRQEFSLNTFPGPTWSYNHSRIRSYVHFPETEQLWNELNLPWDFKFIGKTLGPLADINVNTRDLAWEIFGSGFTLHIKPGGESYGHVLHNSYAMGRPAIINANDFKGQIGGELLVPGSYIDIDECSVDELRTKLLRASEPDEHWKMCRIAFDRFKEIVDFDADAEKMEQFMERLQ